MDTVKPCSHNTAAFALQGRVKPWIYSCECGAIGRGESPGEALSSFSGDVEKRLVEGLKFKRSLGWDLAAHEELAIAYSVHGSAPACHHRHPHENFLLGSA